MVKLTIAAHIILALLFIFHNQQIVYAQSNNLEEVLTETTTQTEASNENLCEENQTNLLDCEENEPQASEEILSEEVIEKGQPNHETVAGTGDELAPQVLAETEEVDVIEKTDLLPETGVNSLINILFGIILITLSLMLRVRTTDNKLSQ